MIVLYLVLPRTSYFHLLYDYKMTDQLSRRNGPFSYNVLEIVISVIS